MTEAGRRSSEGVKVLTRKPPIETTSWCYRDKEEDVHHDFAWTITNFSRKINVVPNSKFFVKGDSKVQFIGQGVSVTQSPMDQLT